MKALVKAIGMTALLAACAEERASTYQAPQTMVETPQTRAPSLPPPSEADIRWIYVGSDLRWDAATVKRTGNIATIWYEAPITEVQRRQLRQFQPTLGNEVTQIVRGRYHVSINCADRKHAALGMAFLNGQGTPVTSFTFKQSDVTWESIPPETNTEFLMRSVCPK